MNIENIVIAPASRNEISDIQLLFRMMFEIYHVDQDIEYPYSENGMSYLKNCVDNHIALVAKDDDRTIGFLTGGIEAALPFKMYRQHGHIHNLFILEAYRGQGIGRRLIRQFMRSCKEKNVSRIITDSDDSEALRRFYASLGFHISGVNYEIDTTGAGFAEISGTYG